MTGNPPDRMDDRVLAGPPGLPRWVKLLALGAVIVVIVVVLVMVFVGGEHGPGIHGG
jgi:hypothetical protein